MNRMLGILQEEQDINSTFKDSPHGMRTSTEMISFDFK